MPRVVETSAPVIVLGRTVLKQLGCDESIIGQHVHVNGNRFLVTGVLEAKGSIFGEDQDKTVMIPYTAALDLLPDRRRWVFFLAEATSEAELDDVLPPRVRRPCALTKAPAPSGTGPKRVAVLPFENLGPAEDEYFADGVTDASNGLEAVDKAAGVQMLNGQINIRGSTGYVQGLNSRVLLLVDGVPMNQGDRGGINWDLLPVDEVKRAEVARRYAAEIRELYEGH